MSRSASKSATCMPFLAQAIAATMPTGPAPTIQTRSVMGPDRRSVRRCPPARRRQRLAGSQLRVVLGEKQIHRRNDEQREQRSDGDAGCDHEAHVEAAYRASAARDEE